MELSPRRISNSLKWRLVPVRHVGRLRHLRPHHLTSAGKAQTDLSREIGTNGYASGPNLQGEALERMQATFLPRIPDQAPDQLKVPFVDLSRPEDLTPDNPLIQLAFSKEVLDVALDYFGERFVLNGLQILHSFPQHGPLKESQEWHLDYCDTPALHCVTYLNDVLRTEDGPLVFVDKEASRQVGRGLIVRRIEDDQFITESGNAEPIAAYGKAGTSVWVDPAACHHYGSRCENGRTAAFVTFNSDKPFNAPTSLITSNAAQLAKIAKELRPDIDPAVIDRMLQL